ncbi:hypothetical protein [Glaciimonas soli]|uniref:Lipoprotein n=1 Tax=Glaciimonas soli TaxID=2590999 RepID=A0A843YS80_9BURK|nr:hypothetical protein [Glaciimonas soli]MQR01990.1 hypothetical protein [Glaciimonas soli]
MMTSIFKNAKLVPIAALAFSSVMLMTLAACKPQKPTTPHPELLKEQRDALDKAKGLEKQMQQQLQDRMKNSDAADEGQK